MFGFIILLISFILRIIPYGALIYLVYIASFSRQKYDWIGIWYANASAIFFIIAILLLIIQRITFTFFEQNIALTQSFPDGKLWRFFKSPFNSHISQILMMSLRAAVAISLAALATPICAESFIAVFAYSVGGLSDEIISVVFICLATVLIVDIYPSIEEDFSVSMAKYLKGVINSADKRNAFGLKLLQIILISFATSLGVYGGTGEDNKQIKLMASVTLSLVFGLLLDSRLFQKREE